MGRVESALAVAALEASRTEVTYVPEPDYHGEDSFVFEACDETESCAMARVTIAVAAANDAPIAREDRANAEAGATITIDVVGNDIDVDGDELRLIEVYRTDHGNVRIVDGLVEFEADEGYEGSVRVDYAVTDASGARAIGTAIIEVTATEEGIPTPTTTVPARPTTTTTPASTTTRPRRPTTTTTAPPVDEPPLAVDDGATVNEDGALSIDVLVNDSDPEGSPLTLSGVGAPLHGTAVVSSGQVQYTPAPDYPGADAFTYSVSDGTNPDVTATVTDTVTPVNDDPEATAPDATVAEDASTGTTVLSVTATDADPGDTLIYAIDSGDPDAKFSIDGNGDLTVIAALDHESTQAHTSD